MEGIFELHWQRREYGDLSLQLYGRCENGQLRYVDSIDAAPFDTTADVCMWLIRSLHRESLLRTV